jgi:hypothetical protein
LFEHLDRRAVVTLVVFSPPVRPAPFDGLAFGAGLAAAGCARLERGDPLCQRVIFARGDRHGLHRSNSSRLTRSMPLTHSRIFSRISLGLAPHALLP